MPPKPKTEPPTSGLDLLRQPFPAHQISKLPKLNYCCSNSQNKVCGKHEKKKCPRCHAYISTGHVDLDFVGHAALTDRLLDADPNWTWEPVPDPASVGLPTLPDMKCMWIRLTVCGVTRYGFGDAQGKTGGDAIKEIIGDALRNAAMRFGAALDLWHKGDLHVDDDTAATAEHQELVHKTLNDEKKADRGVPVDDPWAKPVETDQAWFDQWVAQVAEAQTKEELQNLWAEMVEKHKNLGITDADRTELTDLFKNAAASLTDEPAA